MTIQEYQIAAARTCNDLGSAQDNAMHMKLGIYTEVGELLDVIKKHHAYGKPMDIVNIGEEIADCLFYVANWATGTGVTLSDVSMPFSEYKNLFVTIAYVENIYTCIYKSPFLSPSSDAFHTMVLNLKAVADYFDLDFSKLMQNNIDKLMVRYPEGYEASKAVNRNLDRERAELEKQ